MVDGEGYSRLLAAITVLEEAVIVIGKNLPNKGAEVLADRMRALGQQGGDSPYGLSIRETADRIARSLSVGQA